MIGPGYSWADRQVFVKRRNRQGTGRFDACSSGACLASRSANPSPRSRTHRRLLDSDPHRLASDTHGPDREATFNRFGLLFMAVRMNSNCFSTVSYRFSSFERTIAVTSAPQDAFAALHSKYPWLNVRRGLGHQTVARILEPELIRWLRRSETRPVRRSESRPPRGAFILRVLMRDDDQN